MMVPMTKILPWLAVFCLFLGGCKNTPGGEAKPQPKADQKPIGGKVGDCKT